MALQNTKMRRKTQTILSHLIEKNIQQKRKKNKEEKDEHSEACTACDEEALAQQPGRVAVVVHKDLHLHIPGGGGVV